MRRINVIRINSSQSGCHQWSSELPFGENPEEWLGPASSMNRDELMREKIRFMCRKGAMCLKELQVKAQV